MKMFRILGKRGRITIPYDMRQRVGFQQNDVLSFTESEDGRSVLVTREILCDERCPDKDRGERDAEGTVTLKSFLDGLSQDQQKAALLDAARMLHSHGYRLFATGGTSRYLSGNGIPNTLVHWPSEPDAQPQALDLLHRKEIDLVVNIPKDLTPRELSNGYKIRRAAIDLNIPLITNARLAAAFITAFCTVRVEDIPIKSWDEFI